MTTLNKNEKDKQRTGFNTPHLLEYPTHHGIRRTNSWGETYKYTVWRSKKANKSIMRMWNPWNNNKTMYDKYERHRRESTISERRGYGLVCIQYILNNFSGIKLYENNISINEEVIMWVYEAGVIHLYKFSSQ